MTNPAILKIPLLDSRPVTFLNQQKFRQALAEADSPVEIFKTAIRSMDVHLNLRFKEAENVRSLIHERAALTDCMLHFAWHQFEWSRQITLVAVGGYGRGELHPQSDIDILLLSANDAGSVDVKSIQGFLTLLWDMGLHIGHSVRTLEECVQIAATDITVVTSLMETRLLEGSLQLLKNLQRDTEPEMMWSNEDFFRAKFNEQQARHEKYNDTEYKLEPNVKKGPGGLRDIQTIQWVAKRFFKVRSLEALGGKSFFTEEEYSALVYGEEFLWKVRYGLHTIAGRAEERLLFDFQKELATLFGFRGKEGQMAIEQFMHKYYRIVLSLRELNDVLLQFLDEVILGTRTHSSIKTINERFQLRDNFIEVVHNRVFEENPSALLEIFVLAATAKTIAGIRASTIRLIRENRHLIDDRFRQNLLNNTLFLELLKSPWKMVSQLRRMKRYGILGRYLPEFDRIIGQMQHDLFHIYTVDDHTLNVIEFMRRFLLPNAEERFPIVAEIARKLPKKHLLYIAGLYHDIGKGRDGDHSRLGAQDAIAFSQQHRLPKRDIRLITWLVEQHLIMSYTSQKRDLSDPEVIHEFARLVGDQTHLDYLYVLTVADMNGTNPDIWNNWRASLLQQLYRETSRALRRGLENPIDREELISETRETAMSRLLACSDLSEQAIWELWQTAGDDYFLRETAEDIFWHTQAILNQNDPEQALVLIANHTLEGSHEVTQIFIRALSSKSIFAAVTSALDQLQLNIQDARIYTTVSGYAMDTFYVLDQDGEAVDLEPQKIQLIADHILAELNLSDHYSDIIRRRTPRQLKYFSAPTRTNISNDLSGKYTILEVVSPDRPGFLALLARIFVEYNIELVTAKITTLGERVEDVFYITDKKGNLLSDPKLCEQLQLSIEQQLDAKVTDRSD